MSDSPPPPGASPASRVVTLELEAPAPGLKKLLGGRRGPRTLSLSAGEIVIEHAGILHAPLRFAPGAVAAATVEPGSARVDRNHGVGRFPVLRRLSATAVVPREEGIEGWLWTSTAGSALTQIGEEDVAPNLAFIFLKPLEAQHAEQVFERGPLEEIAKRSPLGKPTVFGLLLRVANSERAREELARLSLIRDLTDREVPPAQRRHLPTDKPADPALHGDPDAARARTSMPPPGMG